MKNEDLLASFNSNALLSNSILEKIVIESYNDILGIELTIQFLHNKEFKGCLIKMKDVQEFQFYHTKNYNFYTIDYYKFMLTDDGYYYLCLDPDESTEDKSQIDQDFILSSEISAELIKHA